MFDVELNLNRGEMGIGRTLASYLGDAWVSGNGKLGACW